MSTFPTVCIHIRSPAIDTVADSIFYVATNGGAYISDYISTYSYGDISPHTNSSFGFIWYIFNLGYTVNLNNSGRNSYGIWWGNVLPNISKNIGGFALRRRIAPAMRTVSTLMVTSATAMATALTVIPTASTLSGYRWCKLYVFYNASRQF